MTVAPIGKREDIIHIRDPIIGAHIEKISQGTLWLDLLMQLNPSKEVNQINGNDMSALRHNPTRWEKPYLLQLYTH